MFIFLRLCTLWLAAGFVCAAIAALYDVIVNRVYIRKRELKSMLLMIIMGIISVPVTIVLLVEDITESRQFKNKNKKYSR